jgi:transposase-like protein
MNRIVSSVTTLLQHIEAIKQTPEIYRPLACPHCGIKIVWQHGYYTRKADRHHDSDDSLNPVPICRYRCSACRRTCSRLPLCIAPRRWYNWSVQQSALEALLNGDSLRGCARTQVRDRRTIGRWWHWLANRRQTFEFHLRTRLPELGRVADFADIWRQVFKSMGLAATMALLDQEMIVP